MVTRLSVRAECRGGAVLDALAPSANLLGRSRLTILIHGYNNDECAAWESYDEFLRRTDLERNPLLVGDVCTFYWPGDKAWGLAAPLSYPSELGPARDSAARLFDYLSELSQAKPIEVALICHSLGNRVAIELLAAFLSAGAPPTIRFTTACLMAAAVPVALVHDAQRLEPAATAIARTLVLFSTGDTVLHWAFPPGETLIAGEGWFPTAVGRFGDPVDVWGERRDLSPYKHSDYWCGNLSAAEVRKFVGIATATPLATNVIAAHALPDTNVPEARHLNDRQLQGGRPPCC